MLIQFPNTLPETQQRYPMFPFALTARLPEVSDSDFKMQEDYNLVDAVAIEAEKLSAYKSIS